MKAKLEEETTKPAHYERLAIDVYEFCHANNLGMLEGNAIKYIVRRKDNRLEDLQKAINTLQRLLELEKDLPR